MVCHMHHPWADETPQEVKVELVIALTKGPLLPAPASCAGLDCKVPHHFLHACDQCKTPAMEGSWRTGCSSSPLRQWSTLSWVQIILIRSLPQVMVFPGVRITLLSSSGLHVIPERSRGEDTSRNTIALLLP